MLGINRFFLILVGLSFSVAASEVPPQGLGAVHKAIQAYAGCVTAIPLAMRKDAMKDNCLRQRQAILKLMPRDEALKTLGELDAVLIVHRSPVQSPDTPDDPDALRAAARRAAELDRAPQARMALEGYYDCVTQHSEFTRSLEAAQAACLTERQSAAGHVPEEAVDELLKQMDVILMARWQNS